MVMRTVNITLNDDCFTIYSQCPSCNYPISYSGSNKNINTNCSKCKARLVINPPSISILNPVVENERHG